MLFIHGDKDTYVPTWMVYPLYEAKPEPKELWIVPGAAHAVSYQENKQEYTDRVRAFVGRYTIKPIITRSFRFITEKVSIFAKIKQAL